MSVTSEDLERIVTEVWRDVLSLEAIPAEGQVVGELTGCIQITGAFRGAVILIVPSTVAHQAAMAMFALDQAAVSPAEERDAIGELTNMIGGHVKATVPSVSQLALPAVVEGCDHCLTRCQLQILAERVMSVSGVPFVVRVMEDIG